METEREMRYEEQPHAPQPSLALHTCGQRRHPQPPRSRLGPEHDAHAAAFAVVQLRAVEGDRDVHAARPGQGVEVGGILRERARALVILVRVLAVVRLLPVLQSGPVRDGAPVQAGVCGRGGEGCRGGRERRNQG